MSTDYKKIKYGTEGAWGSTDYYWLVFVYHGVSDYTEVFSMNLDGSNIHKLFGYSSWNSDEDLSTILIKGLSNWNDMEDVTKEDIGNINKKINNE